MPVAGLVVTLCEAGPLQEMAIANLQSDARITVGTLQSFQRLPLVSEASSLEEQQLLWNSIAATPGVLMVELAYQDFSDVGEFESLSLPTRNRRVHKESDDGSP